MQLQPVSFKKTLNRAYRLLKPSRDEINLFKNNLIRLLERIDHEESEENVKGHLRDFLNDTWYKDKHLIATKGRTDLVIHEERSAQSKPAVLFEVKRPRGSDTTDLKANSDPGEEDVLGRWKFRTGRCSSIRFLNRRSTVRS